MFGYPLLNSLMSKELPVDPIYPHGRNPKSLKNLKPRSAHYDEPKRDRRLTVTESGWLGCKDVAASLGLSGVSEILEKLGRSELKISD